MLGEGFKVKYALIDLAAWPYARALRYNTIQQAEDIRMRGSVDAIESALSAWTESKEKEFKYIAIAATVSAGANVSVFSWQDVPDTVWYARALWYMSLVFSIMTLISIVQVAVMVEDINHYLAGAEQKSRPYRRDAQPISTKHRQDSDTNIKLSSTQMASRSVSGGDARVPVNTTKSNDQTIPHDHLTQPLEQCLSLLLRRRHQRVTQASHRQGGYLPADWTLDGSMLFIWQSPMMFASYSWVAFLLALALHVIRPFLNRLAWSDDHKIAITFLCFFLASLAVCMWCAWFPHYKRLRIPNDSPEHAGLKMSYVATTNSGAQQSSSVTEIAPVWSEA